MCFDEANPQDLWLNSCRLAIWLQNNTNLDIDNTRFLKNSSGNQCQNVNNMSFNCCKLHGGHSARELLSLNLSNDGISAGVLVSSTPSHKYSMRLRSGG